MDCGGDRRVACEAQPRCFAARNSAEFGDGLLANVEVLRAPDAVDGRDCILNRGALSLEVSSDRKTLYVHSMYVRDPESFRREIKDGFERRVRELLR